ncbi:MAG TPA: DNA polymerase III subunit delta [Abditibacteriaceae bacterium]|jgi:DNA polymerase-3 subunit delta|nr:DNA polymerase III subunit delta [Abditibacteriaceae bacterium]
MLPYSATSLKKVLSDKQARRVYGVVGDAYLQNVVAKALIDSVLEPSVRDFNMDNLEGDDTTVSSLLALCGNLPFLAERRVVVVHRAEKIENIDKSGDAGDEAKPSKNAAKMSPAKRLQEGLKTLPPTTMLMLLRTPETPEIGARAATARLINAAVDKTIEADNLGVIIDCTIGAKGNALATTLVKDEANARGIAMEAGAAEYLVERVGTDIARLLSEMEKCALRVGNGAVSRDVINEMVRRTPQDTIFDLTDALGERRGAQALATLRELVGSGEAPERVLATFITHLRKLLQARAFLDAGVPLDASTMNRLPRDLAAQLPQNANENLALILQNPSQAWRGRKFAAQARNFSMTQLQDALEAALSVDLAIKGIEGDGGSSEMLVELFVAGLC